MSQIALVCHSNCGNPVKQRYQCAHIEPKFGKIISIWGSIFAVLLAKTPVTALSHHRKDSKVVAMLFYRHGYKLQ
jgi:hypothetical protein